MAPTRKTKKWYREQIDASYSSAIAVLPEILKKYGDHPHKSRSYWMRCAVSNSRNGELEGIGLVNGTLYANVYWQGDHTDGTSSTKFSSKEICLDAELEDDYRYGGKRERHGNIRFSSDLIYVALKQFKAAYLDDKPKGTSDSSKK